MTNIRNQIADYIFEELLDGECDVDIAQEENLLLTGMLDSLGVMRLVRWMSDTLGVVIPLEDVTIENFVNVEAMATYVESRKAA